MKQLAFIIAFTVSLIASKAQEPKRRFDNKNQGTYTISAGHVSVNNTAYRDTTFLICHLYGLHNGASKPVGKSGYVQIGGKKYSTDSVGKVLIKIPQGNYELKAGSSYDIFPGSVKTKKYFFEKYIEHEVYFYLIKEFRY